MTLKSVASAIAGIFALVCLVQQASSQSVYGPGNGQAYKPGNGQAYLPGNGQAYKPGNGQAYLPGNGQAYKPGNGRAYLPGNGQAYKPGNGQAYQASPYPPGDSDPILGRPVRAATDSDPILGRPVRAVQDSGPILGKRCATFRGTYPNPEGSQPIGTECFVPYLPSGMDLRGKVTQ